MRRRKFPIEYYLEPATLEKGTQWITLLLKNIGHYPLYKLDIRMHSLDSLQISLRNPSHYVYLLAPGEEIM